MSFFASPLLRIKKIRIQNFKSFNESEIEFGDFNLLIGSNASGKSNLIQVFRFLKDISEHGLDNAISLQGGVEFLRNVKIGPAKNFSLQITFVTRRRISFSGAGARKTRYRIMFNEMDYKFSIKLGKRSGYKVIEDRLILYCHAIDREVTSGEKSWRGTIVISALQGRIKFSIDFPPEVELSQHDLFPYFLRREKIGSKTLLMRATTPLHYLFPGWRRFAENISIYDFDPKLPKRAVPITGKKELASDGANLSIVLKNIMTNQDNKRKFTNLIKELLPFVKSINVENFADRSLLFKLQEKYFKNFLPASLISDGTINVAALVIVLFFEQNAFTLIEEPERNIHPSLLVNVINMMKDASRSKQILVTSHNPEVVRHADLENILMVTRDKDGFSQIQKPKDSQSVKNFLSKEIDIGELYIQKLLGE